MQYVYNANVVLYAVVKYYIFREGRADLCQWVCRRGFVCEVCERKSVARVTLFFIGKNIINLENILLYDVGSKKKKDMF